MHYVVLLSDKQKSLMTESLITEHVEYLTLLKSQGVLPFCGPCEDGTAIMILACESLDEARSYVEQDPFSKAGYYQSRRIVGVTEANEQNHFHLDEVLSYLSSRTA